jgi:hypothetical protein
MSSRDSGTGGTTAGVGSGATSMSISELDNPASRKEKKQAKSPLNDYIGRNLAPLHAFICFCAPRVGSTTSGNGVCNGLVTLGDCG